MRNIRQESFQDLCKTKGQEQVCFSEKEENKQGFFGVWGGVEGEYKKHVYFRLLWISATEWTVIHFHLILGSEKEIQRNLEYYKYFPFHLMCDLHDSLVNHSFNSHLSKGKKVLFKMCLVRAPLTYYHLGSIIPWKKNECQHSLKGDIYQLAY